MLTCSILVWFFFIKLNTKQYVVRYRTEGNSFATMIQNIIDKNSKQIISECQAYLNE